MATGICRHQRLSGGHKVKWQSWGLTGLSDAWILVLYIKLRSWNTCLGEKKVNEKLDKLPLNWLKNNRLMRLMLCCVGLCCVVLWSFVRETSPAQKVNSPICFQYPLGQSGIWWTIELVFVPQTTPLRIYSLYRLYYISTQFCHNK